MLLTKIEVKIQKPLKLSGTPIIDSNCAEKESDANATRAIFKFTLLFQKLNNLINSNDFKEIYYFSSAGFYLKIDLTVDFI